MIPQDSFGSLACNAMLSSLSSCLNAGSLLIARGYHREGMEVTQRFILEVKQRFGARDTQSIHVSPLYDDSCSRAEVFLCPFLLDCDIVSSSKMAALAIAFFNMAVADHAESFLYEGLDKRRYLEKARASYVHSMELVDHPELMDPDGPFMYVYLALCLNLDAVERELNLCHRERWSEALENALMSMPPDPENPVYHYFERRIV